MTNEKIKALIEQIAIANYTTASQFAKPSWQFCSGKTLWLDDAKRAMDLAIPEIVEWCAQIAEDDGKKSVAKSIRNLKHLKV